jgi:hypothetical protein
VDPDATSGAQGMRTLVSGPFSAVLLQVLLDSTRLSTALTWLARICAPISAVAFSGALFGLAFSASFSTLLYLGVVLMLIALLTTGVGLLRGVGASPNASPG